MALKMSAQRKGVMIEVQGVKEVQSYLAKQKKGVKLGTTKGVRDATLLALGEIKLSIAGRRAEITSVDTGRFLSSVKFAVGPTNGMVYSNLDYSKYLEYGTSRILPRRHFRNSVYRNQSRITKIFENDIKQELI